jgi:hypothetical protein
MGSQDPDQHCAAWIAKWRAEAKAEARAAMTDPAPPARDPTFTAYKEAFEEWFHDAFSESQETDDARAARELALIAWLAVEKELRALIAPRGPSIKRAEEQ